MLADNIVFLKKNYPTLYEALKNDEDKIKKSSIVLEDTKNNYKTLKMTKGDKTLYLHSKYDPIREAESIIDKLEEREEIDTNSHVIFYGLGLGYHIDAFVRRFPDTTFSLYEPSEEVFEIFLNYKKLKDLPIKKMIAVQCEVNTEAMDDFFNTVLINTDKKTIIMDLPIYQNAFEEQYTQFSNRFMEAIKSKRSLLNTNYSFQNRWILNSVNNFDKVLNTPNILMQDKNNFKNKTAILVSAGPSLDYEIENLHTIKEKGLAYIFSVGSAINTLLYNDILPDAMCTYDPKEENRTVFKKVNEMKINTIPMLFGSSVGYEVLKDYTGPQYHMITSQDTVSNYFLKEKDGKEIDKVNDAPSIAVVTLELLSKLEFSTIILVGQNLAYKDEKNYAKGIDYHQNDIEEIKEQKIKDVLGNEILTSVSFNDMRKQMEFYIKSLNISVINTTVGGAQIEGAKFIPMDNVINDILQHKIVQGDEFKSLMQSDLYDKEYLQSKINLLDDEFTDYVGLLSKIKQHILKVRELLDISNTKQAGIMYERLDSYIVKLEANDFFNVIAMPMNRVQYEILSNDVQRIKREKNELKRLKRLIKHIKPVFDLLYIDNNNNLNQNIMKVLSNNINNFVETK
ncbi:motility associated factor glycosyltransferase family protein [Acetobacterium tundrae]|uniref:DUF115 domain-containing protein n=1 Tax=Acetobacterium tundrae TaxID=132932 RepID=A0ABR6WKW2_9FIRM|nr:6-hydroxymethylpterin diphosphokinase MptE-like protein [Acetobacterium tundrae]MBC3797062.1 DUF115 domain-containing protein [Acetobacterium tundrae]